MLTLSQVRMEMLTDMILSGEWTDKMPRPAMKAAPLPAQPPETPEPLADEIAREEAPHET
jgi:hypothetical protein